MSSVRVPTLELPQPSWCSRVPGAAELLAAARDGTGVRVPADVADLEAGHATASVYAARF